MKKRMLSALLALCILMTVVAVAEPAEAPAAAAPVTYTHNGRVTLIDGACTDAPIVSIEDAAQVVDSVLAELGGDANTQLEPWRTLTDAYGNRYHVFQQMYDNTTVLGGAVKVITDGEGNMLGLTSSIEDNPADAAVSEGITAEEAERIVLDNAMKTRQQSLSVVQGLTDRMILPIAIHLDFEEGESEGSRYVWVVYTDNPDSTMDRSSDLPYLAHYVTMTGEYLYSLPTIVPGDEAGATGFDASYIFEFMEPVNYTGYVDLSTGEEKEISVDVMRDKRTGMYYLGNIERRIVVADCWEFLYNGNRIVVASSTDNLEWDQVGLLSLYNYCRAYDYYKEIGWIGGDGLGTPILVLNDYCDQNHVPVNNAAYVGGYLGWQMFLASQANDYSQSLDVLAHEFTHCVTGSVMTYNAYKNDYGAINEAMSDIQGKTCEMLMEGRENVTWELGDMSAEAIRSMEAPHRFSQPEFTWDIHYTPSVRTPTVLNDQGGVHTNSSLLNHLAYRLYEKGGMTLEEGRAFWFTVDCAMVPGTDYAQLSELLPLALRITGLEQYDAELQRALDATRLGVETIPETFDEDRALLTLNLPENKAFEDEQWVLMLVSVNVDKLFSAIGEIIGGVLSHDYSVLPQFLQDMLNAAEQPELDKENRNVLSGALDAILSLFKDDAAEGESLTERYDDLTEEFMDWLNEYLKDVFYYGNTNSGQDGRTMRMVCLPGNALPVLVHGIYNENTSTLEDVSMIAYVCGQWIDVFGLVRDAEAMEEAGEKNALSPEMEAYIDSFVESIDGIDGLDDILDLLFFHIQGGEQNVLPNNGLENLDPVTDVLPNDEEASKTYEPRKSRPKLDVEEAQDAAEEEQDAAEEAQDTVEEAQDTVEEVQDTVEEVQDAAEEAQDVIEEVPDAVEEAQDVVEEAQDTVEEEQDTLEEAQDVVEEAQDTVEEEQDDVDVAA